MHPIWKLCPRTIYCLYSLNWLPTHNIFLCMGIVVVFMQYSRCSALSTSSAAAARMLASLSASVLHSTASVSISARSLVVAAPATATVMSSVSRPSGVPSSSRSAFRFCKCGRRVSTSGGQSFAQAISRVAVCLKSILWSGTTLKTSSAGVDLSGSL